MQINPAELSAGFLHIYTHVAGVLAVLSEFNLVTGVGAKKPHFGTFSLCLAGFL